MLRGIAEEAFGSEEPGANSDHHTPAGDSQAAPRQKAGPPAERRVRTASDVEVNDDVMRLSSSRKNDRPHVLTH